MSEDLLDLDAGRAARLEKNPSVPLRFGGQTYTLPSELPADALEPLLAFDQDIALLLRTAADVARNRDTATDAADLVIDLLIQRPSVFTDLIAAVSTVARRLMGEETYTALLTWRPSDKDLFQLAKGLWDRYGIRLGEALRSSASSETDGRISKSTSNVTTILTPEESGVNPEPPTSSEFGASAS
jgi:hypothetical protein